VTPVAGVVPRSSFAVTNGSSDVGRPPRPRVHSGERGSTIVRCGERDRRVEALTSIDTGRSFAVANATPDVGRPPRPRVHSGERGSAIVRCGERDRRVGAHRHGQRGSPFAGANTGPWRHFQ